jgi:hypothetical protein
MCQQYDIIPIICTGVVDTGGNLLPVSTTPWCTFTCEYLRKFFGKIRNDPNVIFGGLGKMIHEENLKQKIS